MLSFFRKYQRVVFMFTAVIVIVTFVFFGVFERQPIQEHVRDETPIGQLIDGKKLKKSDLQILSSFLSSSVLTGTFERHFVNPFNDGVITNEFLKTQIAHLLVKTYFEKLLPDLEDRFKKIKNYTPYQHPEAPFLSAKLLWDNYKPRINQNIEKIKQKEKVDEEFFTLLVQLYLDQLEFPSEYLRRILSYHQSQYSWIRPDTRLEQDDFALFGFGSLKDWFGETFIEVVSQFVLNTAVLAEQKGYYVSMDEAKEELMLNFSKVQQQNNLPYKTTLSYLGLKEKEAIVTWQKVLLFRRYFNDLASSVLVDLLPFQTFSEFASQKATIDLYQMQKELVFNTFADLLKFQLYIEGVSDLKKDSLDLPEKNKDIEKIAADFVKKTYRVSFSKIDEELLSRKVTIKEMQNWQLQDNNWKLLEKSFTYLKKNSATDSEKRFEALQILDMRQRLEVDSFSRKEIVKSNPQWIEQELAKLEKKETDLDIYSNQSTPIDVKDTQKFETFLQTLTLNQDTIYSEDQKTHYQIKLLEKQGVKKILTYKEAIAKGILDQILDNYLEKKYPEVRVTAPSVFKDDKGNFKPLDEVKDLVGVYAFSSLLKEIDSDYKKVHKTIGWTPGTGTTHFYNSHRFYKYLRTALGDISKNPKESNYLYDGSGSSFKDQWKLVKEEKTIEKSSDYSIKDQIFLTEKFSAIVPLENQLCFFEVKEKKIDKEAALKQKEQAQNELKLSAIKELAENLITQIKEKEAMVFLEKIK